MPRLVPILLLLLLPTALFTLSLATTRTLRDQVKVPSFTARISRTGSIRFPSIPALPPLLRSLKLKPTTPTHFSATSSILPNLVHATATLRRATLTLALTAPPITVRLRVIAKTRRTLTLRGSARHVFPRPFGLRMYRTNRTVPQAVSALTTLLRSGNTPARLVAVINYTTVLAPAGFRLAPSALVVLANPAVGTRLWLARLATGVELPVEVLVAASPLGVVYVCWNSASILRVRFRLGGVSREVDTALGMIDAGLARFAGVAAGRELKAAGKGFDVDRIPRVNGMRVRRGTGDAKEAFDRLVTAVEAAPDPFFIAFLVDHAKAGVEAGFDVRARQNRVLLLGNPELDAGIMQQSFTAAIDIPIKFSVWTNGGNRYSVGFTNPVWFGRRHSVKTLPNGLPFLLGFQEAALGK